MLGNSTIWNALAEMPRKLSCKLELSNSNTITDVKLLTYSSDWTGNITIGQVVSSYINVTVPTPIFALAGLNVTLYMGVTISNAVTWTQIGVFRIDEKSIRTRQGYTSFKAFDKLYYAVNTYHSTGDKSLQAICDEICRDYIGITSATVSPNLTIDSSMLDGYTLRDVLGFIAAYQGKNAYLSPYGVLQFRWFAAASYTAEGTRANVPYIGENNSTVGRLICQTADGVISEGSGEGIYFTCPFMDRTRLANMVSGLSLTYRKADVDIPYGNFCLQSGDIITVTTVQNQTLSVPIMNNSWTYDGGLSSTVAAYDVSDYSGTANNAERSVSARRVQSVLAEHKAANRVNEAIQEATDTITGATGGIMRINMGANGKPAELLILQYGDISITPQRVFRLNENGLGYSDQGYNGPYATAITANGLIVTDRFVGNTISGVTLETIASGTGSRPKVVIENGVYELKRVATDDTVHDVGAVKYVPRGDYDELDTVAIQAESGNEIAIGTPTYDYLTFYTDMSVAPSGAERFNFYGGHIRIYSSYEGDMISLQDKLHDFEDRIYRLEHPT